MYDNNKNTANRDTTEQKNVENVTKIKDIDPELLCRVLSKGYEKDYEKEREPKVVKITMDKGQAKFLIFLALIFIIPSIIACVNAANDIGGLFFGIFVLLFGLICLVNGISSLKKWEKYEDQLYAERQKQKAKIRSFLKQIVRIYMLNITNAQIESLLSKSEPKNILEAFNQMISHKTPTVNEFCDNLTKKCNVLLRKLNLSEENSNVLNSYIQQAIYELRQTITIEEIREIISANSKYIPDELYALRDRVEYESVAFEIFIQYSKDADDKFVANKVNSLMSKRGYEPIEAQKDDIEYKIKKYVETIYKTTEHFLENSSSNIIKKSQTAKLDYHLYIFMNLYHFLCPKTDAQFVCKFANEFFQCLKNKFENFITVSEFNAIIDDRLSKYDDIYQNSEDVDGSLLHIIEHFLTNDIYLKEPLSDKIFIVPVTEKIELSVEINTNYTAIMETTSSVFDELVQIYVNQK